MTVCSSRSLASSALVVVVIVTAGLLAGPAAAAPEGQMTWAVHISLAPTWFDPAETPGIITPFMILYALHDALVKPMPGSPMAPSLAESWTASPDGLAYEFVLRRGVRFHNGDPVTAEDVKFSFERYRGTAASTFKARVAAVDVIDAQRVRFRFKEPWPDFMTFYGTPATGAGWVVPKKYVEKVGDDGFKKAPVGAGPYKFVSFNPGVEIVLEANEQYWRKIPSVKRLVFKAVPDESTRLAMLKRGEADVAYSIRGALAEEVRRTPGLTLKPNYPPGTFWLAFVDQWDGKSPWADRRVRLAANHALDKNAINEAETLGLSKITGSLIPHTFDFYWPAPPFAFDAQKAKQLLREAGYPNGLDAGDYYCDISYANVAEAAVNYLKAVGIRVQLRPLERAAFFAQYREKKLRNIVQSGSGAFGNAATRLEAFVVGGGAYVYGSYGDIDGLFREQASETDRKKREAVLQRIQQLMHDKAMVAPIWELAFINAHGPRVAESGLTLITSHAYSSPYEDLKLKGK
ncbi:MAG TPA: ABC transporter substrate-binding protein [Methylomirabilota bacterium]|jgi:peptide/nickel transport system substrate-binding protein|nr:ABC transporter substrate-binding protein [Methylomirabilota bacterium]